MALPEGQTNIFPSFLSSWDTFYVGGLPAMVNDYEFQINYLTAGVGPSVAIPESWYGKAITIGCSSMSANTTLVISDGSTQLGVLSSSSLETTVIIPANMSSGTMKISASPAVDPLTISGAYAYEGALEPSVIAQYKFITAYSTVPIFNDGFEYTYEDVDNSDGTTIRTIESTSSPTYINFMDCAGLLEVNELDISGLTSLDSMFYNCKSLVSVNLADWDTRNITNMEWVFCNCESLESIDLTNWDVSNVTSMYGMFSEYKSEDDEEEEDGCKSLVSVGDLSKWNVGNVTNMTCLFSKCSALTSVGDISGWNVSSVTSMNCMFYYCKSLKELDLSQWNVGNVIDMYWLLGDCNSLTSVGDLSNWNVSSVINMESMFFNCNSLTSLGDISNWDVSSVYDMGWMFADCGSLEHLDISRWDVSNVTNMYKMFGIDSELSDHIGCASLYSLDISNFKINDEANIENMFDGSPNLIHIGMLYCDQASCEKIQSVLPNIDRLQRTIWVKNTTAGVYATNEYILFKDYKNEVQKVRIPQSLKMINGYKDRFYWDNSKGKYCIEQWINIPDNYSSALSNSLVLSTANIIETDITEKIAFDTSCPYMSFFANSTIEPSNITIRFPFKEGFTSDVTVNVLATNYSSNEETFTMESSINLNRGDYIETEIDLSDMSETSTYSLRSTDSTGTKSNIFSACDQNQVLGYSFNYSSSNNALEVLAVLNSDEGQMISKEIILTSKLLKIKIDRLGVYINDAKVVFDNNDMFNSLKEQMVSLSMIAICVGANKAFYNFIRTILKNKDEDELGHFNDYDHYHQVCTGYPLIIEDEKLCYIHNSYITEIYGNTIQNESDLSDIESIKKLKFVILSSYFKFGKEGK